jgi:DNA mismatch endonuclease, patch repair protein
MSRIKSSGTSPEKLLHSLLRRILGSNCRIRRNVSTLPGQPDFVIPNWRLAIFVEGCFYHVCPKHGHTPKSNRAYWVPKLARNARRDKAKVRALRRMGFSVWRIWEHSLKGRRIQRTSELLCKRLAKRAAVRRPERLPGNPGTEERISRLHARAIRLKNNSSRAFISAS